MINMLEPSVSTLMEHVPSRFMLVNVAAQRARAIAEQAEIRQAPLRTKAISMAISELADGKLKAYPYYRD